MLDVQKERFRQLMAGAILDLWKKETGSLASVFIEATVCITSCNSRMTVIQLSDHFPGLIPEPPGPPGAERPFKVAGTEAAWSSPVGRASLQLAGQKRKMPEDCIHRRKKPEMMVIGGGGGGSTAPRDVTERRHHHHQQQQRHLVTDNNNNPTVDVDDDDDDDDEEGDGEFSEETDKEEEDSSEESEDEAEDQRRSTSGESTSGTVGLIPGTGLVYTHGKPSPGADKAAKAAGDDSAIQDMSTNSLVIDMSLNDDDDDDCSNNTSPVDSKYQASEVRSSSHPTRPKTNGVPGGVDPTQNDADLLISSPQNYTEQVRDVIRSRLLNGKSKTKYPGEFFQMPVTGSTPKSFEASSPAMGGLARPFDMSTAWSLIKREKTGVVMDGRLFQQHFPPASAALHLIPSRKSFMDAVVGGSAQLPPDCHPSALQQFFGIGNGSLDPSESKIFPEPSKGTPAEPDENPESHAGLTRAFMDQKIGKFDGGGGVLPDGNTTTANNNNEQKTYKCGFCQKTFLFKSKYHEHLPVHTSARPFECHMCTRTYKYKYDLRVHLRTHLGIPTKSTICPFCSGKFLTNKLLRNHIKEAHREQQQITEEQCAQSLDNVAALSPSVSSG